MRRVFAIVIVSIAFAGAARAASGQTPDMSSMPGMSMPMTMPGPLGIDGMRDGSGTSWLPDESPMLGPMRQRGPWMLMLHGNGFLQEVHTSGARGTTQFGSVNWLMGMAERDMAGGRFTMRVMLSLEPLTVGRCGYPNMLQSGELCRGVALHDEQHPHDLFMEVAADFKRAVSTSVAVEVYGGPSGEPALGPVAFAHRPSAMTDPIAPISHHWLDSSHVSFGVLTGAVYGPRWKAETSVFNGREPDDNRYDFDFGALDAYSARVTLMPTPQWAIQVSAGHLPQAEARPDGSREDVTRITASATRHRLLNGRLWATTVAWGQNREHDVATSALLAETSAEVTRDDTWFGRLEIAAKTAADLALPFPASTTFAVLKIAAGYTRWVYEDRGVKAGVGGTLGLSRVPPSLSSFYGGRSPLELAVFLNIRPK